MDPGNRLSEALERAYIQFSGYPRPAALDASPLRDAAAILRVLSGAPLRELTGEQIGPYAGWALTTVGSVADYKHFLPRILEQAVRSDVWLGTAPPIIAQRLIRAEWRSWTAADKGKVMAVFMEAWTQACAEHPDFGADASDWLCAIAALGEDLSPLLARWISSPSLNAILQIASFADKGRKLWSRSSDELAYWDYVDKRRRNQVADWLISTTVRMALQRAMDDAAADDRMWIENVLKALDAAAGGRPS